MSVIGGKPLEVTVIERLLKHLPNPDELGVRLFNYRIDEKVWDNYLRNISEQISTIIPRLEVKTIGLRGEEIFYVEPTKDNLLKIVRYNKSIAERDCIEFRDSPTIVLEEAVWKKLDGNRVEYEIKLTPCEFTSECYLEEPEFIRKIREEFDIWPKEKKPATLSIGGGYL